MTDIILIICNVYTFNNRVNHSHQTLRSSIGKLYFLRVLPVNDHGNLNYKATWLYYNLHSQKRSVLELCKFAQFRTKKVTGIFHICNNHIINQSSCYIKKNQYVNTYIKEPKYPGFAYQHYLDLFIKKAPQGTTWDYTQYHKHIMDLCFKFWPASTNKCKHCTVVLAFAEYLKGTGAMEPTWNKSWHLHILTHCPALPCEHRLS